MVILNETGGACLIFFCFQEYNSLNSEKTEIFLNQKIRILPDFWKFSIVFKLQSLQYCIFSPLQHHHSLMFAITKCRLDAPCIETFEVRSDFKKNGAGFDEGVFWEGSTPPHGGGLWVRKRLSNSKGLQSGPLPSGWE